MPLQAGLSLYPYFYGKMCKSRRKSVNLKRCGMHGKGHINREIFKKHLYYWLNYYIINTYTKGT